MLPVDRELRHLTPEPEKSQNYTMNKKRILVTGAAGAVGTEVLKELCKTAGHLEVRAFDLPGKKSRKILKPFKNIIEFIGGSVEDASALNEAVRDVDLVIHLAAVIPPLADEYPELAGRVNVWGTHNVVEAMKRYAPDAFLLYSSSVSVYGDRVNNPWIAVGDTLKPSDGDMYGGSKVTAEKLVENSGLDYSIFRFTGIMSPGQVTSGRIDPMLFHMPLNTSLELATTRDCGFAMARAIYHLGDLKGRTFNLSGGEACRVEYRELLSRTFDVLGMDFSKLDENAFATRNFHCGFFKDSDELEQILHFQRDSVETYLQWISETMPRWRRIVVSLVRKRAIRFLLSKSDPMNALKAGNEILIRRFFGTTPVLSISG